MRHFYLFLFFIGSLSACTSNTPVLPAVYTYGSEHRFIVQQEGEEAYEELILLVGDGHASHFSTANGFSLKFGDLNGPSATWKSINSLTGDTTVFYDEVVTDNAEAFGFSYPATGLLRLAEFIPSLYYEKSMKPADKSLNNYQTISGNNSIALTDKQLERTYTGIASLATPDTTHQQVHRLQAQLTSHRGTIKHTYYFHDSLGFVFSRIVYPDGSAVTVSRK